MNNPYEAPKSDVRDVEPQRLLAKRPRQVLYAMLSFWLSYLVSLRLRYQSLVSLLQQSANATEGLNVSVFVGFVGPVMFGFGFMAFLIVANVAMWRGRNWARIVFLIFSVRSVLSFVQVLLQGLQATFTEIVLFVVATVLNVMVSYLLFTKPGALWFRKVRHV